MATYSKHLARSSIGSDTDLAVVFWGSMKPTFKLGNVYPPYYYQPTSDFESIQVLTTSLVGNTLVLWTVLAHRRLDFDFYMK